MGVGGEPGVVEDLGVAVGGGGPGWWWVGRLGVAVGGEYFANGPRVAVGGGGPGWLCGGVRGPRGWGGGWWGCNGWPVV